VRGLSFIIGRFGRRPARSALIAHVIPAIISAGFRNNINLTSWPSRLVRLFSNSGPEAAGAAEQMITPPRLGRPPVLIGAAKSFGPNRSGIP
jgi:hypothetical protein